MLQNRSGVNLRRRLIVVILGCYAIFFLLAISSSLLFSKREDNTTDLRLIFIHVIANLWRLFEVTANNSQEAMNVYLATDKLCGFGCHEADFQRRCICGILQMNLMNELKRWV